ncbi:MAG: glycine betaine ABC transporter substrate-binding protein [Bacillota bacterium]|nr:glycine betaine ABC transporter substrate-binding protein [Bacillota bacterium]
MRKNLKLILTLAMILVIVALAGCSNQDEVSTIRIGHKNFTEQRILGQMFAVIIEAKTDYDTDVKEFGGTQLVFEAVNNNEIDLYGDYTGTLYTAMLQMEGENDPDKVKDIVKERIEAEYPLNLLEPLGFNNTYTLSVDRAVAEKYNLTKVSDLIEYGPELTLGATMEFLEREDGMVGLKRVYGITFKEEVGLDPGIRYTAIENGNVDLIDAFSTDGKIKEYDLVILEDDKQFFPPYYVMSILNDEAFENYPDAVEALRMLEGQISEDEMQEMNYLIDEEGLSERKVAEDFLRNKGLIE